MQLRFYAPKGEDKQTPHDQDELYIVARGKGFFRCDDRRAAFGLATCSMPGPGRCIASRISARTWSCGWCSMGRRAARPDAPPGSEIEMD